MILLTSSNSTFDQFDNQQNTGWEGIENILNTEIIKLNMGEIYMKILIYGRFMIEMYKKEYIAKEYNF